MKVDFREFELRHSHIVGLKINGLTGSNHRGVEFSDKN